MKLNHLKNKIVVLSTICNNKPHTIVVEVNDIIGDKVIITNNQMKKTPLNIMKNPHVCLVYWSKNSGTRIEGIATYFNSGKWLQYVKSLSENKGFHAKGAIIIKIKKIVKLG